MRAFLSLSWRLLVVQAVIGGWFIGALDASAATYTATTEAELASHVSAAAASAESDTINITPGTIALSSQITYSGSSSIVIAGAGRAATTLTMPTGGAPASVLALTGSGVAEVRDMRIERSGPVLSESAIVRLAAAGSSIRRVDLVSIGDDAYAWGVIAAGASSVVTDVTIDVVAGNGLALRGGASADWVEITGGAVAATGVQLQDASDISHAKVSDFAVGVDAVATINSTDDAAGSFRITDSVIDIGTGAGPIVRATTPTGPRAAMAETFRISRSTMVGRANGIIGMWGNARVAGDTLNLSMDRSILYVPGSTDPWECPASPGIEYISMGGTIHAAIPLANTGQFCDSQGYGGNSEAAPKFVDLAGRDYRLRWDAVEVDRTYDDAAPVLDLASKPRIVDGNGDGTSYIDLGAYEYQPTPPAIHSLTASSTTVPWGQSVTFTVSASDADAQLPLSYTWKKSINAYQSSAVGNSDFATSFGAYGTWTVEVTVRDASNAPTKASMQVVVTAPPPTTTGPTDTTGTTDRIAPRMTQLLAPTRRLRRDRTVIRRLARGGTSANAVRVSLTENARLSVQVTTLTGRRIGIARVLTGIPRGTSYLAWGGKVGATSIAPGCYLWQVTARDAANNPSVRKTVRVCLAR